MELIHPCKQLKIWDTLLLSWPLDLFLVAPLLELLQQAVKEAQVDKETKGLL